MIEFFQRLFEPDFAARGPCECWGWTVRLTASMTVADALVFLAYVAIPVAIFWALGRRRDLLPSRVVHVSFALFILACGLGHALDAVTNWWPVYRLSIVWRWVTAGVSWWAIWSIFAFLRSIGDRYVSRAEFDRVGSELRALQSKLRAPDE